MHGTGWKCVTGLSSVGLYSVGADPVHFPPAHHLVFANHRDVVLRLTSHHARIATVAFVQVKGHAPCVPGVDKFLVERIVLRRHFKAFVRKRRILLVFLERRYAQNLPTFHVEVVLRAR
jgi:hypothetical protein